MVAIVGLLGGTFDPVHRGHLALARAAFSALSLDRLHLIPACVPAQKFFVTSPEHRCEMLRLALNEDCSEKERSCWLIDEIELRRGGCSYSLDTVRQFRLNWGQSQSLVLVMGSDQFHNLFRWYRYEELLNFVHIAVASREGYELSIEKLPPVMQQYALKHKVNDAASAACLDSPCGALIFFSMENVQISSTQLRALLWKQFSSGVSTALPNSVVRYIKENNLYKKIN